MTRTSAELEREVEDARGRLSQTAEALKEKMQPRDLLDEATTMMGQTGEKMLSTAADHLRENPIPIALIGLGVAWLALESGRRARRADGLDVRYATHEGYDVGEDDGVAARAKAGAEMAKAKLSKAAEKAKARLADAQSQAEEGVSAARHKAADYVHAAQAKADAYGRAAKTRFDETLDHEPLVIGAIGVAVGAAIGASLPATEAERRYIGPARAKAAERAKESLDGVRHVAERTYAQVKDELRRQAGATGDAP
ncbi:DUF3618 domain-containing protein [Phenylobacterium sp. SCN 70-31]|uniref:DUF3618 domain-containing protein n=1 Tax=Phenylobacterium sp. SCN 70-31 TaxID=1660129 RepID=UPI00086D6108|nr:DUF3618 domain-containing protein [Phenylobacterium sp. SCN 70-31]ODT88514.1 MAG: hypothetical protein ABS78_07850 [Phenylobacterium sp. SCN 70-31]